MAESQLRWLHDTYHQTQKLRIGVGNQISAVQRETDDAPIPSIIKELYASLNEYEGGLVNDMEEAVKDHPAMSWLKEVKGIGPILACKVLGQISDISTFTTVSKLWRFAGYAVIDGKREYPVKGEKLHYSKPFKTTLYLVGTSFIKCNSPYRKIYDDAKAFYIENRDWTLIHSHRAAMRKMIKIFLQHLWLVWRKKLNLECGMPYVFEKMAGHTTYIGPWDMIEGSS